VRLGFRALGRRVQPVRMLLLIALLLAMGSEGLRLGARQELGFASSGADDAPIWMQSNRREGSLTLEARLPLVFEKNEGQTDRQVKFLARGDGYGLFLTPNEAVLKLQSSRNKSKQQPSVVRMRLAKANDRPAVTGTGQLPGKSNYFISKDSAKWRRNVPQFARVRYREVYPGVDLVYYGKQGHLEYDFELAPGADPNEVALQFAGLQKLTINQAGDVVLASDASDLSLRAPRAYQFVGGQQRTITSRFVLREHDQVGFELGPYDHGRALVIDPVLSYSTYLGGSGEEACPGRITIGTVSSPPAGCPAIAVDSAFNIYVAGSTTSSDFPPAGTPFQGTPAATPDVFVAKLNAQGQLVFSTYLGGNFTDFTAGLAVDGASQVIVAGSTTSTNFPTKGAYQTTAASAGQHAFVSELLPDGSDLVYSTYLSGGGTDTATGVALDATGKIYLSGITASANFPTTTGAFQTTPKATNQFFMSKIDPTLSGVPSLVYSTYIGGSSSPSSGGVVLGGGIAVDTNASAPSVYVSGGTDFTNMPVLNAANGTNAGKVDAWVAKFTPTSPPGTQEIYLTYLGGTENDVATAVAVDGSGQAYVTGYTLSPSITAASGTTPFQANNSGGVDAFLFKIGGSVPSGQTAYPINYFTYLGGSGTDVASSITLDALQGARIAGWTTSGDLPSINSRFQGTFAGLVDAFVARIDTTATTATAAGHFGVYLGGGGSDLGTSIAGDILGDTYITGETSSGDFPRVTPLQASLNGTSDAFISKFAPQANLAFSPAPTATPAIVGVGNAVAFKYTIVNSGDFVSNAIFTDFLTGGTLGTVPGNCNQSTSSSTLICDLGALNAGQTTSITVSLTSTTGGTLSNSAQLSVGSSTTPTASASAIVTDFSIDVSPKTATVVAGTPASYTVTLIPSVNGADSFPDAASISCSSSLPTGASCTFPNDASISNLNNGAQTRQLVINTTARVTTPASLFQSGAPIYAAWFPISGLALFGAGMVRTKRSRRMLYGLLLGVFGALLAFQAGCSSSKSTSTTTGTPAGDYSITITATSGTATRTQQVVLTVQ
jgi:hypothetical protein